MSINGRALVVSDKPRVWQGWLIREQKEALGESEPHLLSGISEALAALEAHLKWKSR